MDRRGGTGNVVLGNSIFSNDGLGINLAGGTEDSFGVTANDSTDPDSGSNDLQNYPDLTAATRDGSNTAIAGNLNSLAGTQFLIEFFSNAQPNASGFGEGQTPIGTQFQVNTYDTGVQFSPEIAYDPDGRPEWVLRNRRELSHHAPVATSSRSSPLTSATAIAEP